MSDVAQSVDVEPAGAARLHPVAIVSESWRFLLTHPVAVLRTAWLPLAVLAWVSLPDGGAGTRPANPEMLLRHLAAGAAVLAILILALVAWQRLVFYGADRRRGPSALRFGRAEILTLLHFPLVEIIFVPLQLWPIILWLANAPAPLGGGFAAWMPWIAFAVIVFPGGPYLARATLMLPAIAAAGSKRFSLSGTANRVWAVGSGNTVRLFLTILLAGLPIALAARTLDGIDQTGWGTGPQIAASLLRGATMLLYVFVVGGALARAWSELGGMDSKGRLPHSRRR